MLVRYLALGAALLLGAAPLTAQTATLTATEHIAMGDHAHDSLDAPAAYLNYKEAVTLEPNNYEALWKAAREAVDLGEYEPDNAKQKQFYDEGLEYAKRAEAANPNDAEGHFHVARALGRVALSLGKKERVHYAKEIRQEALTALRIDSLHPGALHVMGRWNAEIMRLSGLSRFFARNFLGGDVFGEASWKNAVSYMEKSVQQDPNRLVHHLDLAEIYADVGQKDKARAEFEAVINGKATDYNDAHYKEQAQKDLAKL